MKVMLIQPPSSAQYIDKIYMHEPLALEYLSAGLKFDNHEVVIIDARLELNYEAALRSYKPHVVGLTGYTNQLSIVKNMAKKIKVIDPGIFVIVGGHHATVKPEDFNVQDIDLVVRGEGVVALREILQCLESDNSFDSVRGLGIPGSEMDLTPARPHPNLDDLPLPDRSLTSKYREHYFDEWMKPLASIRTSLGCVARCTFCALWAITGGKYLVRQPESIIKELQSIEEPNVFFCDDESMCDRRRMDKLADLIRQSGVKKKYYLYARVDTIVKYPDLFAKWKDVGLAEVFVGFEGFSNEQLKDLKKNVTVEQQQKAAEILRDLEIGIIGSFMVDPSYTKKDFGQLISHIRNLKVDNAVCGILTPLPGTQLYENKKTELISHKPEFYDFLHTVLPTALPLKQFYAEFARLQLKKTTLLTGLKFLRKYEKGRRLTTWLSFFEVIRAIKNNYRSS
ncbi:MAG: B12-binding domain-containing radical SAM protein [Desulfitobacteriaceae bacterium]